MTFNPLLPRREFLERSALAVAAIALGPATRRLSVAEPGRFATRPHKPSKEVAPGEHVLFEEGGRRSILFVPASYDAKRPAPFALALHGATQSGDWMLRGSRAAAEAHGVILLSPSSTGPTWDALHRGYAEDFSRIDKLLNETFDRCSIDPAKLAIVGFSDGATYALSAGLMNGDLFTHIIAHSPGFIIPGRPHGRPKVFVSHGRQDPILPIDRCGRVVVAQLQRAGYDPRFDEFDGGHVASPEMRDTAMRWFIG
jgi:phospholipase/carboxylesterase